jgi:choline kinase
MKAVILAAGRGSRLGSLTDDAPKCFTELAGKRLIDRQMSALSHAGISDIGVVRGYLADKLALPGLHLFDNPRWKETNMVMSLASAASWLSKDECVVSYSDIVYHPDHVAQLQRAKGDIVITYDTDWRRLWELRMEDPLADAETFDVDERGHLLTIGERPVSMDQVKGQYMGLFKITPRGWQSIADHLESLEPVRRDKLDVTSLLRALLAAGVTIHTTPVAGRWLEVDTLSDLNAYQEALKTDNSWDWLSTL